MLARDHPTRARRNIAGYTLQAGKRTPATDELGTGAILALVEKLNPYREDSPKRASDCAVGSLRPYRWSTPLPAAARAPREARSCTMLLVKTPATANLLARVVSCLGVLQPVAAASRRREAVWAARWQLGGSLWSGGFNCRQLSESQRGRRVGL